MKSASPGPTSTGTPSRLSTTCSASWERLGDLERRPDPDDLRSKRVALTPRGTSAIVAIREAVDDVEVAWAEQLGPERFAQLRNLLLDLNQLT